MASTLDNPTGINNVAVGSGALSSNTSGKENVATGYLSLGSNTIGVENTAVGTFSLNSNTSGTGNTSNGYHTLSNNSTGSYNTAIGYWSLFANTNGQNNTATGYGSLLSNTSGFLNTANGFRALYYNNTGLYNTAVGSYALQNTTSSQYNTAIGYNAGSFYDLGYNNTFLGANTNASANDLYNVIAIGQDVTCTASNQARIGNAATTSIGGQVGWTTLSDERMKTNIQENVKGLEFIKLLRPVTYNIDAHKVDQWYGKHRDKSKMIPDASAQIMQNAINEKSRKVYSGFLAQDVEKAVKAARYNFGGIDVPQNDNDLYGLRYEEFVVPLVKAVQEQQQIIETQNKKIDLLQQQMDTMIKEIQKLKENK